MKLFKSLAITACVLFSANTFALTDAQQTELLHKGTITIFDADGSKKGHFEVRFMLGTDNLAKQTESHWKSAADLLTDLVRTEDFWQKKILKSFFDGVNYASDCCRDGVCSIPNQFCSVVDKNNDIHGFGSSAAKLRNWLEFCGTCIKDVFLTAWGIGTGTIWAVVAPTAQILYRPIASGSEAILAGTVWPAIAYTYTGIAYEMVKNSEEPKEGDFTVTWIPNRLNKKEMAQLNGVHPDDHDGL